MSRDYILTRKQVEWAYEKWAYYPIEKIAEALFVSKHCITNALRRYGYDKKPKREKLVYGKFE